MNTVLETLYLRRPKIEYISPPVCPIVFSASGTATFDQCFNDQSFCNLGKINNNFLHFDQPPDAFAFNVYSSIQQTGQPFTLVNDGIPANTAVVFTAGTYWFTLNLSDGTETAPFPSKVADGVNYLQIPIPQEAGSVSANLYKDGTKLVSNLTGIIVEGPTEGWYQATKITADGESPLEGCSPVLLSVPEVITLRTNLEAYWQYDTWSDGGFGLVAPPPSPGVRPSNSIADVTFLDSTPNHHDLTIFGYGDNSHAGILVRGYEPANFFDTAYLSDNTRLIGAPSFTMQTWVLFNNATFGNFLMGRGLRNTPAIQDFHLNTFLGVPFGQRLTLSLFDNLGTQYDVDSGVPTINLFWYHIVAGYDADNQEGWIQVNNAARVILPGIPNVRNVCSIFSVGNWGDQTAAAQATLDESAFWRRTLTTAEVSELYNSGAALPYSAF